MTAISRRSPSSRMQESTIWTGDYFLSPEIASFDLGAWEDILPVGYRIIGANLFADIFIEDTRGGISMLETAANQVSWIVDTRERFLAESLDDWNGWLLRPLVDRCRELGMMPAPDQCFAMMTLPQFGGAHEVGNLWLCDWRSWLGYSGFVYSQDRDLRMASVGERIAASPTWPA